MPNGFLSTSFLKSGKYAKTHIQIRKENTTLKIVKVQSLKASILSVAIGFGLFIYLSSCKKKQMNKEIHSEQTIQLKVDSLLAKMTLDEKIGQMTQVRHFDDITEEQVATRYIGSIIHTQGPLPGETPEEWQAK
ncbi:MAG: hypothetical protein AAFP96_04745, partial [Bacteroidota bacterium]